MQQSLPSYTTIRLLGILFIITLYLGAVQNVQAKGIKTNNGQEQVIRQERQLTTIHGQTSTNLINRNSYVETISASKLSKKPGSKPQGKSVKKGTRGVVIDELKYINNEVWWKIKFSTSTIGWVAERKLKRIPSTVLFFDGDGDGIKESSMRFVGDYESGYFAFRNENGGTEIRYFETKEKAQRDGFTIISSTDGIK